MQENNNLTGEFLVSSLGNSDNISRQEHQAEIKRQLQTKEYLSNPIYHWAVRMAEEATEQARRSQGF